MAILVSKKPDRYAVRREVCKRLFIHIGIDDQYIERCAAQDFSDGDHRVERIAGGNEGAPGRQWSAKFCMGQRAVQIHGNLVRDRLSVP
jgi:hypothetical protein